MRACDQALHRTKLGWRIVRPESCGITAAAAHRCQSHSQIKRCQSEREHCRARTSTSSLGCRLGLGDPVLEFRVKSRCLAPHSLSLCVTLLAAGGNTFSEEFETAFMIPTVQI